jgi:RNA polymerase sigma factor (sigma-70 family)
MAAAWGLQQRGPANTGHSWSGLPGGSAVSNRGAGMGSVPSGSGDVHGVVLDESDSDLVERVRSGDRAAFETLFERHRGMARYVAARQTDNPADVDDVVSDAFASVFESLTAGKGPDSFFRAYLLTAVRRTAYKVNRTGSRTRPTDELYVLDSTEVHHDPVLAQFESTAVAQAFKALPERWQAVLWYVDIEGLKPAAASPMLGLSANGVSSLALRARERLRQVYLQQHVSASVGEDCEAYSSQLGVYARNGLGKRSTEKVQLHLEECFRCTALLLDLNDVQSAMRAALFPLVTGIAFTAAVPTLAGGAAAGGAVAGGAAAGGATAGGAAGGAAAGIGATPDGSAVPAAAHAASKPMVMLWKVGAGVLTVVAVGVGTALAFAGSPPPTTSAAVPTVGAMPTLPNVDGPSASEPVATGEFSRDPAKEQQTVPFPLPLPTVPDKGKENPDRFPSLPDAQRPPAILPGLPSSPGNPVFPLPPSSPGNPVFPLPPAPGPTNPTTPPPAIPTQTPLPTPTPSSTTPVEPQPEAGATFRTEAGTTAADINVIITFNLPNNAAPSEAEAVFTISDGSDMIPGKLKAPAGWSCTNDTASTRQFHCTSTAVDPDVLEFTLGITRKGTTETTTLDYQFSGTGLNTAHFSNTF